MCHFGFRVANLPSYTVTKNLPRNDEKQRQEVQKIEKDEGHKAGLHDHFQRYCLFHLPRSNFIKKLQGILKF